jgi:hypothetical protein
MSSLPATRQRRCSILSTAHRPPILNSSDNITVPVRSRKARPTISLTNKNVSCINNPHQIPVTDLSNSLTQNIIPFPTSLDNESDYINLLRCPPINQNSPEPHPRTSPSASQVDLRHRRSQARLAQSPLSRKDAQKGTKSKSKDSGSGSSRRTARTRKQDLQLLETVYRSIAWRLASGRADEAQEIFNRSRVDPELNALMEAQDRLFVERLCEVMVELGYPPFTITASDSPFLTEPLPSPSPTRPLIWPDDSPVLTMPQLVATIMLRRRDRARKAARPERSSIWAASSPRGSPLARVH